MTKDSVNPDDLRDEKIRLLWRLRYAHSHISAAEEAISQHLQLNLSDKDPLHRVLAFAIVVRYATPFIGCRTLGRLESEWAKFSDQKMQTLHNNLIDGRNAFYAHTDPTRFAPMLIHVRRATEISPYHFEYCNRNEEKWLVSANLPEIKVLCEYQSTRIMEAITPVQTQVIPFPHAHELLLAANSTEITVEIPFPVARR